MPLSVFRRSAVEMRELMRPWLPSGLLATLPPVRNRLLDLCDVQVDAGLASRARVSLRLACDVDVPPRRSPLAAYPSRWLEFERPPERTPHRAFVATLESASVSGLLPAVVTCGGDLVVQASRTLDEPIATHQTYARLSIGAPTYLSGRTLLLAGGHSGNFYHWMIDTLPRMALLERAGIPLSEFDHVLLPQGDGAFIEESLTPVPGLRAQRHTLDNAHHFACESLTCPTNPHPYGDVTLNDVLFLRRLLAPPECPVRHERLFLSRAKSRRRRLANEEEIWTELLEPAGFIRVYPEELSLREQLALMSQAAAIVAPHGAALAHLALASAECSVVELVPDSYPGARHFRNLAETCSQPYRYVVCATGSSRPDNTVDFTADLKAISAALADSGLMAAHPATVALSQCSAPA